MNDRMAVEHQDYEGVSIRDRKGELIRVSEAERERYHAAL